MSAERAAPCRVFLSRTSEFADAHAGPSSYLQAAHSAVGRAGHAVVEMSQFTASPDPAPRLCAEKVRACDVFVVLAGFRYGSLVRRQPPESYCEFEYRIAGGYGKPRLAFLLAEEARPSAAQPVDHAERQTHFRRRLCHTGVVATFTSPDNLAMLIHQALLEAVPHGCGHPGPAMNLSIGSVDGIDVGQGVRQVRPDRVEGEEFDAGKFHF